MKDYKFFMNVLMESEIMVERPLRSYVHIFEIEKDFELGQYFKAVMHLTCLIQSNLYELLLKKLPSPPQSFKAFEVKKMQELPLKSLIDWVIGKPISRRNNLACYPNNWKIPIINEDERLILYNLREIRNDLAHVPYLCYNSNIRKEIVEKIIKDVTPIHHKLVEEIMRTNEAQTKNASQ